MAPPHLPVPLHQDDPIIQMTPAEWHAAKERELNELGMTYDELAQEARRHEFRSAQARMLWVIIGEPETRS